MDYKCAIPAKTYRTYFKFLFMVCLISFTIVLFLESIGISLGELAIAGINLNKNAFWVFAVKALVAGLIFGGIGNVFVVLKLIKIRAGFLKWPLEMFLPIIIMLPLELVVGMLFVIPDIIYFAYKGYYHKTIKADVRY